MDKCADTGRAPSARTGLYIVAYFAFPKSCSLASSLWLIISRIHDIIRISDHVWSVNDRSLPRGIHRRAGGFEIGRGFQALVDR